MVHLKQDHLNSLCDGELKIICEERQELLPLCGSLKIKSEKLILQNSKLKVWLNYEMLGDEESVATDVSNDECENVKLGPNSNQNN